MFHPYHSGEDNEEATPVPIPNTEVKLLCAEDTWLETARENRFSPDFFMSFFINIFIPLLATIVRNVV